MVDWSDKQEVLEAVKKNGFHLLYASDELRNDREIVLAAVKQDGLDLLGYASTELKNDREVVLVAVKQNGNALQKASDELKNERDVVLEAVKQDGRALQYASDELKNDRDFVLALLSASADYKNDRDFVLAAVKQDGYALCYASTELQNDREVVLEAVKQNGYVLEYASDELKNDREVVLEAVKQEGRALMYASDALRSNREVVLAVVKRYGHALNNASDELRNDREVVLEAVKQDGRALMYASAQLNNDRDVVLAAVKQNGSALNDASDELRNDRDFVLEAVKQNGLALLCVRFRNDLEVVLKAVKQDPRAFKYASKRLQNDITVRHAAGAPSHTRNTAVPDTPSTVDRLGYSVYAKALANATRQAEDPSSSVCVGLYARWGGGKSTLWNICKSYLQAEMIKEDVDILLNDFERFDSNHHPPRLEEATGIACQRAFDAMMKNPYTSQIERTAREQRMSHRLIEIGIRDDKRPTFIDWYIFRFIQFIECRWNYVPKLPPTDVEEGVPASIPGYNKSRQIAQNENAALLIMLSLKIAVLAVIFGCLGFAPRISKYFFLSFLLATPAVIFGFLATRGYCCLGESIEKEDTERIKNIRALMCGNGNSSESTARGICGCTGVILLHMLTSCISLVSLAVKQIILIIKPCISCQYDFTPVGATSYVTVEFNAWAYSGSDLLWASLIKMLWDAVESKYGKKAVRLYRASIELAGNASTAEKRKQALWKHQMNLLSSAILFILVAVTVLVLWLTAPSSIKSVVEQVLDQSGSEEDKDSSEEDKDSFSIWAPIIASISFLPFLANVIKFLKMVLPYLRKARGHYILETAKMSSERKDFSKKIGFMGEVKKEVEYLIDFLQTTAYKDDDIGCNRKLRLCIFIDDLDRCPEKIVVSVLEAVILLLVDGPITVWLAIDSRVVVECIESVKKDVYRTAQISGHEFLDKIVQLPFCLPNLTDDQKMEYLTRIDSSQLEPEQLRNNLEKILENLLDIDQKIKFQEDMKEWGKGEYGSCAKSKALLQLIHMRRFLEESGIVQQNRRVSEVMDSITQDIDSFRNPNEDNIEEFCYGLTQLEGQTIADDRPEPSRNQDKQEESNDNLTKHVGSAPNESTEEYQIQSSHIAKNQTTNLNGISQPEIKGSKETADGRTESSRNQGKQEISNINSTKQYKAGDQDVQDQINPPEEEHLKIASIPETLNRHEKKALRQYKRFLDGNPRRLKRIMNSFNVCRAVYSQWNGDVNMGIATTKILKFVILLEQWPTRMSWLMQFIEDVEQNCSLGKAKEQLKVLEDDLKTILAHQDGIIHQDGCGAIGMLQKLPASDIYEQFVRRLMYSSPEAKKLLVLDSDPQLFVGLLDVGSDKMMGSDLILPSSEDADKKKHASLRKYAFNLPISVTTKVSRMIDELSVQPGGWYCPIEHDRKANAVKEDVS